MAKRLRRVHVECATSTGFRWLRRNVTGGLPPVGQINTDDSITVLRPDRFEQMLAAAECRVVETLQGTRKRKKR